MLRLHSFMIAALVMRDVCGQGSFRVYILMVWVNACGCILYSVYSCKLYLVALPVLSAVQLSAVECSAYCLLSFSFELGHSAVHSRDERE